jgi:hypothetical protein
LNRIFAIRLFRFLEHLQRDGKRDVLLQSIFPDFAKTKTSSNSWDSEKRTEERQLFANEKNPKD